MYRTIFLSMLIVSVGVSVVSVSNVAGQQKKKRGPERWEKKIQAFEQMDKKNPPPKDPILFVGSSSIVRWKLPNYFPDLEVINRGFGGSQMSELLHFTPRIVLGYKPRVIVVYEGDNDINAGKSPEQVMKDFKAFIEMVQAKLPKTKIIFICVKPSLRRWKQADQQRTFNSMLEKRCKADKRLVYVDVFKPMLGRDGEPRKELFVKDGVHLTDTGYRLWTSLVKPLLTNGTR